MTAVQRWYLRPTTEFASFSTRGVRRRYVSSSTVSVSPAIHHLRASRRVCVSSVLRPHDTRDYRVVRGSVAKA